MSNFIWNEVIQKTLIAILLVASPCLVHGAKQQTEAEWNKCRDKAIKNVMVAGEAVEAIIKKCGKRPVVVTQTSVSLLKTDCDSLYGTLEDECKNKDDCGDANIDGLSMASLRGIQLMDNKVFSRKNFDAACLKACKSKTVEPREKFGIKICGGS